MSPPDKNEIVSKATLEDKATGPRVSTLSNVPQEELRKKHQFWDTQPVPKISDNLSSKTGPLEDPKKVEDVKQEPYRLPPDFEWCALDLDSSEQMIELFELLENHYVEDDDACFRFNYSIDFLKWALSPPGYRLDWNVGVRANKKLVAFISAIPATICVRGVVLDVVEVNFLCVHKKLRSKRLAPVLIREITRRVNLAGRWQALYTAGIFLPRPIADCRYCHRPLNIRKLIECGFSALKPNQKMPEVEKMYSLPQTHVCNGIRRMEDRDAATIAELFAEQMRKTESQLYPILTAADVQHWLSPRTDVVQCFVKEIDGKVTDFFSFYVLPSKILRFNFLHKKLEAAYNYYCGGQTMTKHDMLLASLIEAKKLNYDVFNALELSENKPCFDDLQFGLGDGTLKYYLFNWQCPPIEEDHVGIILL